MNYAINSTDENDTYSFFLPIVNHLWSKIGYYPVSILVGDEALWKTNLVYKYVQDTSKVVFIKPVEGFRRSTTAQTSRVIVAASALFNPTDYLLTSDADMLPLNKKFYNDQCGTKDIHLMNADAYTDITKGWEPIRFPICHIGATVATWREVMTLTSTDVQAEVQKAMIGRADIWNNDEEYFTGRLKGSRFYKERCQMMVRGGFAEYSRAKDRLDRENWWFNGTQRNYLDCHFPRPGFDHLDKLRLLISTYFPDTVTYINAYITDFMKGRRK